MKWVSVKDELPNDNQIVIAFNNTKYFNAHILILGFAGGMFREIDKNADIDMSTRYRQITHWRKLPKPPKEYCF
jgi:hypothetical protein